MTAKDALDSLCRGIMDEMNRYGTVIIHTTFIVFSFPANEFDRDFYKGSFAIKGKRYVTRKHLLNATVELFGLIRNNCRNDQYLQIRSQNDMTIYFEYTAKTTLGEEIRACVDSFQALLGSKYPSLYENNCEYEEVSRSEEEDIEYQPPSPLPPLPL